MKAEINNENKAKFFALYWGQKVFMKPYYSIDEIDTVQAYCLAGGQGYLELKPLSSISDEDALNVANITQGPEELNTPKKGRFYIECMMNYESHTLLCFKEVSSVIDYLRSKCYLVDYMGLSPEEIINAGWVKYK